MNEKLHIEVIIPYFPQNNMSDYAIEQFDLATNEIVEIFNTEIFDFEYLLPKSKLEFKKSGNFNVTEYYLFHFLKNLELYFKDECFIISLDTELDIKQYHDLRNFTVEDRARYDSSRLKSFIAGHFQAIVYEIIFSANIARPGCISVFEGGVYINNTKFQDTYGFSHLLQAACDTSLKIKYPEICFYDTKTIRQWIKDNGISFFYSEKPNNKLSIAIYCLTYVCSFDLNSAENLIYSMIALEALYTKGNSNITEQLNEKIQIYLGPLNEYKKSIKNMYSLRSRFLHGDLPIKPIFFYNNTTDLDYEDEIYDALLISTRILIRTVQKMIIENRTELDFEFKLK